MILQVVRYLAVCRDCGVTGPEEWPTIEQAERYLDQCPCRLGTVIEKPTERLWRALAHCDDAISEAN